MDATPARFEEAVQPEIPQVLASSELRYVSAKYRQDNVFFHQPYRRPSAQNQFHVLGTSTKLFGVTQTKHPLA